MARAGERRGDGRLQRAWWRGRGIDGGWREMAGLEAGPGHTEVTVKNSIGAERSGTRSRIGTGGLWAYSGALQ